ncbi:hypothetical protein VTK73DRAFT_4727 [Phialemonium thermophilum]|uniref:F-box domain-containing protein n=1 Tax=Phialemonium thermophilum TaxID=223376 RepID=A0ABR3V6E8_9PEZI
MPYVRPRLRQGQYFGEVASLGLSEGRTATVRSITTVECLIIGGDALEELWRRCPPEIKRQVEATARTRYRRKSGDGDDHDHDPDDEDVEMQDAGGAEKTLRAPSPLATQNLPQMAFTTTPSLPPSPTKEDDDSETRQPSDPDPYLSVDMENLRNRRRNSLAPPPAQQAASDATITGLISGGIKTTTTTTTIHAAADHEGLMMMRASPQTLTPPEDTPGPFKRARTLPSRPHSAAALEEDDEERRKAGPRLPDTILVRVFRHLDILEMLRLRAVCRQWRHVLEESPQLCTHVDLGSLNRRVTDGSLAHVFAPFIGQRPVEVDISNCFHVTDEGFQALWRQCGQNVKVWKMRSVWEVSASQILEMSESAKGLEEVDWSNCRKVGDSLLARVVGWVVPETTATRESSRNVVISSSNAKARAQQQQQQKQQQAATTSTQGSGPAPGTVVGCPSLRRLNLSYCKHITDRSMAHLAAHASSRLERLSLTRCTSITDAGFQSWAPYRFAALTHLSLADCTWWR